MRHVPWVLMLCAVLARGAVDEFGNTLWPEEQGAPAGYPGAFPGTKEVTDKETGELRTVPVYPIWGFPELLPYPGSVEHFRSKMIKYVPVLPLFDATTLVRNWPAAELGGTAESFAEPIYYMPMYGNPVFTGKHRAPIPVVRLKADGSNALAVTVGKLSRSLHAVRIVVAIQSETKDWTGDPERIVASCTVNDRPDGGSRTYTRRLRAVDQFYGSGEWYFQALDDREYKVEIRLEAESQVDLLVANLDLHDVLAGCPEAIVKQRPTIYTAESREAAQRYFETQGEVSRSWGPNIPIPKGNGLWKGEPLAPDARRARDEALWQVPPPEVTLNAQGPSQYGKYDRAELTPEEIAQHGKWEIPFQTRYRRNWDQVRSLKNSLTGEVYTLDDYLNRKPLPGPFGDRGWGAFIPERGYYHPVMSAFNNDDADYGVYGHSEVGGLCVEYFNRGNLEAARDAAFILCRLAYTQPAAITDYKRWLQQVVSRSAQCFEFNDPVNRRYCGTYGLGVLERNARAYDLLFDFIEGNQELASSVGRFIPWIKTPADLRAFLDQRLLRWPMQQVMAWRTITSHGTPEQAVTFALIAGDAAATKPLMDWLFTKTWDYPLPLSGLQDYASAATTRDGTTTIGSFMYTVGGSPFVEVAQKIRTYIANGGDPRYDLADLQRYPKPFFGAYFNLDGRVAGYWPLGVGDVGGVLYSNQWFGSQEDAVRVGWRYWRDPRLAWILANAFGRKDETAAEWEAIGVAAATVPRNPWLANRSRVMSAWGAILESGTHHDDIRFRRAATVRVGVGWGHSHRDTLDLQLFATGCQMTPDGGQRPSYGRPECQASMNHNVVEVDGDGGHREGNWEGHAFAALLADLPGAPVTRVVAVPPLDQARAKSAVRLVALVDVDEGQPPALPAGDPLLPDAVLPQAAAFPKSYVLDVYRVVGGKRHTYGFHGCPEDEFTVNAANVRQVPLPTAGVVDPDATYLRKYVLDDFRHAGDATGNVVATWRMSREPFLFSTSSGKLDEGQTKEYKCPAPEPHNLGKNFDPAAPRRYTRLHLLDQAGARLRWGRWVSAPYTGTYGQWFTQLHVTRDAEADADLDSTFVAVIETYAGDPAVAAVRRLTAAEGVAVEVGTTNGHTDLHLAGVTGPVESSLGPASANAVYASLSVTDGKTLRQAGLAEGTALTVPDLVTIAAPLAAIGGRIAAIDHLQRTFELDLDPAADAAAVPELLAPAFWRVGNADHQTSLEVTHVERLAAGKLRVTFRKGLELFSTRVRAVDPATRIVTGKLTSILMGAEEDNGLKPGMTEGLWATDDAMTAWWRVTYLGGTRADGYRYQLDGPPVDTQAFPIGGTLRLFELGPGDDATLASAVGLALDPTDPSRYEVRTNLPAALTLPGGAWQISTDGQAWTAFDGTVRQARAWLRPLPR